MLRCWSLALNATGTIRTAKTEYTKLPTTWLNNGCWEDDPLPTKNVDPYEAEQARIRDKKIAEARRFIEEERRVRGQEQS